MTAAFAISSCYVNFPATTCEQSTLVENYTNPADFNFSTDSSGNMTGWEFDALLASSSEFMTSQGEDSWFRGSCNPFFECFSFFGPAGTWTAATATPEPPTSILLLIGVGLLLSVAARRKHELGARRFARLS